MTHGIATGRGHVDLRRVRDRGGARAIRARNADVGYAIAAILTLGAVSLFALPAIGHGLSLTDHEFGLWSGLAVDNTAETTATGYAYSDAAGKLVVLFTVRVLHWGVVD